MVVPTNCYHSIVLELMKKKTDIETRINNFGLVLRRNNIGMNEPVVDDHGFPRNDIDVHQVREARHQIICLQNDLKETMKSIESGLHDIHAAVDGNEEGCDASTKMSNVNDRARREADDCGNLKPFVRVDVVSRGSPAEESDFQVNDEIVSFGSVNATNFRGLAHIAEIVKNREKEMIMVKVVRDATVVELGLIPHPWSGRGLLGCNIVLCDNVDR